jgi:hypothetical protein
MNKGEIRVATIVKDELRGSVSRSRIEKQHKFKKFMNGRTTQKQLKEVHLEHKRNNTPTIETQHEAHMHSRKVLVQ